MKQEEYRIQVRVLPKGDNRTLNGWEDGGYDENGLHYFLRLNPACLNLDRAPQEELRATMNELVKSSIRERGGKLEREMLFTLKME
jgi:hypothetical protein